MNVRWFTIFISYVKPNGKEMIPNGALAEDYGNNLDNYIEAASYEEAVQSYRQSNEWQRPVIEADPYYLGVDALPDDADYDWGAIIIVQEKDLYTKTEILEHRRTRDRKLANKKHQEYVLPQNVPDWLSEDVKVSVKGCWLWTGPIDIRGYGWSGKDRSMHRRVFSQIVSEELTSDVILCHQCHNRMCVNPNHLLPANALVNSEDMVVANRTNFESGKVDLGYIVPESLYYSLISEDRIEARRALASGAFSKRKLAAIYKVPYKVITAAVKPGLDLKEVSAIRLSYYLDEKNISQLAEKYCIEPDLVSRIVEYKKAFVKMPAD